MSEAKTYAAAWNENAYLVMLKELAKQSDGRLNEMLLSLTLDAFGYRMTRGMVKGAMRVLEELGAARIEAVADDKGGEFLIATITREGVEHLERRAFLDGIAKPSLGV